MQVANRKASFQSALGAASVAAAIAFSTGAAQASAAAPKYVEEIATKTDALRVKGHPTSFWNYAFIWLNCEHFTEEAVKEWADAVIS